MSFGFIVLSNRGTVEFRFSGPVCGEEACANLSFQRAGANACALAGRLYHREDARAVLKPPPAQASDAALALALYEQLGADGLARLEGDFALTIWDGERSRLVGRRDPLGAYPLFWVSAGSLAAFATDLGPLLALLPRCAVDADHLASFVLSPPSGSEPASERCAYEGVHRVVPTTIVSLDTRTGEASRAICWDWASSAIDPGTERLDDIAQRYGELLRHAVKARLGARIAVQVSGGMDSTSVMLLALEHIRAGAAAAPLHTLSLVYDRLPVLKREQAYVDLALAADRAHTVTHRIAADHMLFYDNHARLPVHHEPHAGLWLSGSDDAMTEAAANSGVTVILTGQGADDLLDMLPYHLADMIRRGHLVGAWKEACAWARGRGSTPWRILQLCALPDLAAGFRRSPFGRVFARPRPLARLSDAMVPAWIQPAFAARHALAERAASEEESAPRAAGTPRLARALGSIARRVGNPVCAMHAAPRGIAMTHPFLDPRVIAYAMGMQERFRPDPSAVKPVLAEAMRGRLPEPIRTRRDKRSFNETYYLGLSRNAAGLKRLVEDSPDPFGMFDKPALLAGIETAALGIGDARALYRLDVALAALAWLSNEREWRQRPAGWGHTVCVTAVPGSSNQA